MSGYSRKQYYTMVWQYKKRRYELKNKYTGREYTKRRLRLQRKINTWKCQIKRIDSRNKRIKRLALAVNKYFGQNIKNIVCKKDHWLAMNVFYKYGIEDGIQGVFLAQYLKRKDYSMPSRLRLKFTKSFRTDKTNREEYHKFKKYYESIW